MSKTLLQFVAPTLKAIFGVIGIIVSVTMTSYYGIKSIATAQGEVVEAKVMAVRNADFQHINSRFDRTDAKLDKLLEVIREK